MFHFSPSPSTYVQISSSGSEPQNNSEVESSCIEKKKEYQKLLYKWANLIIHYSAPFSSQMFHEHYTLCNITNTKYVLHMIAKAEALWNQAHGLKL